MPGRFDQPVLQNGTTITQQNRRSECTMQHAGGAKDLVRLFTVRHGADGISSRVASCSPMRRSSTRSIHAIIQHEARRWLPIQHLLRAAAACHRLIVPESSRSTGVVIQPRLSIQLTRQRSTRSLEFSMQQQPGAGSSRYMEVGFSVISQRAVFRLCRRRHISRRCLAAQTTFEVIGCSRGLESPRQTATLSPPIEQYSFPCGRHVFRSNALQHLSKTMASRSI